MNSYLIILSIIAAVGSAIECGLGVPVLTRIPNDLGTYAVEYQCLCPVDYYGIQCRHHRKIACYLTTKEFAPNIVDTTNFEEQKTFNVTIAAECYLEQANGKFISFINYFFKRQTKGQDYQQELQSGVDGGEIVWANNSELLTQTGMVKYQQGYDYTTDENGTKYLLKSDEQKILYGNGPYKFEYKSSFLGFPLTNSTFQVSSNIYKVLLNNRVLPKQEVQFVNYDNYTEILKDAYEKQEEAKSIYSNFSISKFDFNDFSFDNISRQIEKLGKEVTQFTKIDIIPQFRATISAKLKEEAQFGLLKAQFRIDQTYQQKAQYTSVRHTSINSATVRIPIRVPGIGQATVYNPNFYKRPSRIVYFIYVGLAIGAIYVAYRLYQKRKINKRKKLIEKVQRQYEEDQLK